MANRSQFVLMSFLFVMEEQAMLYEIIAKVNVFVATRDTLANVMLGIEFDRRSTGERLTKILEAILVRSRKTRRERIERGLLGRRIRGCVDRRDRQYV